MTHNGIDPARLAALAEVLQQHPAAGALDVEVRARWQGAYRVDVATHEVVLGGTSLPRDHELRSDLVEALGGADGGPAPGELLLAALSACVTQGLVEAAAGQGVDLDSLEVRTTAAVDLRGAAGIEGVRAGVERAHLSFRVGASAPDEALDALLAHAVRTSPVADSLAGSVSLTASIVQGAPA